MILLRSQDKYSEFAELHPQLGILRWFTVTLAEARSIQVAGRVAKMEGSVL